MSTAMPRVIEKVRLLLSEGWRARFDSQRESISLKAVCTNYNGAGQGSGTVHVFVTVKTEGVVDRAVGGFEVTSEDLWALRRAGIAVAVSSREGFGGLLGDPARGEVTGTDLLGPDDGDAA